MSASWQALVSSLAARHREDTARRQYFESRAMTVQFSIAGEPGR